VCNCGRGRVRHDRGRVVGVVGHVGKVVQEVQESVQNELCALQAAAGARDWWCVTRVARADRVCEARDARSHVVESRSAAGARWRATYLHRVYSQCVFSGV
jgi:hypothetical protein